jgi:hypothetical protein
MARTTKADLAAQGEQAVVRAFRSLGHQVEASAKGAAWDLTSTVDGIEVRVAIKAAAIITPETVARMVHDSDKRRNELAHVAVGDLVTAAAQDALREAGWGWLDRRGHLVLRAKGVHIDADVPADERPTAGGPVRTISGMAAISWAAALLISPEDPPSMREVARRVSLSHSAIVAAAKRLKAASLVRGDGRPLVPELFWALAEEWRPRSVALEELPTGGSTGTYGAPGTGLEPDGPGWAVAGTVGAAAWGAPVVVGSNYPPDFYVLTTAELRQATLRLGEASRFEDRACTVAVAPTPLVCVDRFPRSDDWGQWSFAHGLFAALDLAQDRARGAEILESWNPTEFARVW